MKTTIYILRHSETDYNVDRRHDHEGKAMITKKGQQRAEIISGLLGNSKISAIYSSPLPRCIDTVTPLANTLGQKVIIDKRIRENFLGPIQDKLWSDFPRDFLDEVHDINGKDYEGYEHMRDVHGRVSEFIDSVANNHKGEAIIVCSHAGPIVHMLSHIDKVLPNLAPAEMISNTGVTHQDAYAVREI